MAVALQQSGTKREQRQATQWLTEAAQRGDTEASYYLGLAYLEGTGVARDTQRARELFEQVIPTDSGRLRELARQGLARCKK